MPNSVARQWHRIKGPITEQVVAEAKRGKRCRQAYLWEVLIKVKAVLAAFRGQ